MVPVVLEHLLRSCDRRAIAAVHGRPDRILRLGISIIGDVPKKEDGSPKENMGLARVRRAICADAAGGVVTRPSGQLAEMVPE